MEQSTGSAVYHAKKSKKGILIAILVIAVIGTFIIMIFSHSTKEYIYREFHITLNNGFRELDLTEKLHLTSAFGYESPDYSLIHDGQTMYLYRYNKSDYNISDLEEFGEKARESFDGDPTMLSWRNSYCYFEITKDMVNSKTGTATGNKQKSVVAVFKSSDAFWVVDIGEDEKTFREEDYLKMTDTVKFVE